MWDWTEEGHDEMEVQEDAAGACGAADVERPVPEEEEEDFAGACSVACDIQPPEPDYRCDCCECLFMLSLIHT